MTTQFEPWLADLRRAGRRMPDGAVHIVRDLPFFWPLAMTGNWADHDLRASLRLYPDAPGEPLAAFNLTEEGYNSGLEVTQWTLWLHKGQTWALPSSDAGDGVAGLAMDVLFKPKSSTDWTRLMGGVAMISGRVTDGS